MVPTNEEVGQINEYMFDQMFGALHTYLSQDKLCDSKQHNSMTKSLYLHKFLNSITLLGIPNHSLKLKLGAPLMLLRNLVAV